MIAIMLSAIHTVFEEARIRRVPRTGTLFVANDLVARMFLIVDGVVTLQRHTASGATIVLQRAVAGVVVAEASAYTQRYHCDAIAETDADVRAIPISAFRKALTDNPKLAEIWATHLAQAVQSARLKAEIRTLRTVAERLDAWLGASGELPAKGQWQSLAAELGVTREALYREMAQRRIR